MFYLEKSIHLIFGYGYILTKFPAKGKKNIDGTYLLILEVEFKKVYSDSLGVQMNGKLNDWLEIGVLAEEIIKGKKQLVPIYIEKIFVTDSISTFDITLDQEPFKAGVDPLNKFFDRDSKDNLMSVSFED